MKDAGWSAAQLGLDRGAQALEVGQARAAGAQVRGDVGVLDLGIAPVERRLDVDVQQLHGPLAPGVHGIGEESTDLPPDSLYGDLLPPESLPKPDWDWAPDNERRRR